MTGSEFGLIGVVMLVLTTPTSLYPLYSLPLEGMKRKIMRQLRTLEQEEMVTSKNDYQDIISAIAKVHMYN